MFRGKLYHPKNIFATINAATIPAKSAKEWSYVGDYVPAAAYSDEIISIYLAKGLCLGTQDLDEDEFLDVFMMPLIDAAKMCINGEITDGKTIAGILKVFYLEEK